jgi:hypothetical protein
VSERIEFDAVIEATGRGGGALVRLPPDAAERFDTRARFPVSVTFNGVPYRGSTMPNGDGTFCVGITKAIQASAGAGIGAVIHVVVERDEAERTVEVPADLAEALAARPGAADAFSEMAYTYRKEFARWLTEAKKPETRARRLAQAVEMIAAGKRLS